MGRFDKIKVHNGTSFVQPNQLKFKAFTFPIRYIYIYQQGSTANAGDHLCQVEAYTKDGNNVAFNKTITCGPSGYTVNNATNAVKAVLDDTYAYITPEDSSRTWFIVDLGQEYDLDYIKVWRYYPDGRTYYATAITVTNEAGREARLHEYTQQPLYAESANGFRGEWVDLGANDSDNKRSMYVFDGSAWQRKSLNKVVRQTGTNYTFDGWTSFWPNAASGYFGGRNNNGYHQGAEYNASIPGGYAAWDCTSWDLLDWNNSNAYGWAAINSTYANVWRSFTFRFSGHNKWLHNVVFWSASSSYWQGCPCKTEVWVNDFSTYIGTFAFSNPGNRDSAFWTQGIDYKPNGGIRNFSLNIYDGGNAGEWKVGVHSLRMRAFHCEGGNANTIPVYTTYWE